MERGFGAVGGLEGVVEEEVVVRVIGAAGTWS
jgi:hypothetical protein